MMARFSSVDTKAELVLRRALHSAGILGYRLHLRSIPGRPDVAFTKWRVAVFVDGVFWHGHPAFFSPGTLGPYWDKKIEGNRIRDQRTTYSLEAMGWIVMRFWETEVVADPCAVVESIGKALQTRTRT
jgi:DNA mismatch endonuclease (patch repair protein)